MNKAIIGIKLGMSQVFTADGKVIPVTVVEAGPCPVVRRKTVEKDGYDALQISFGDIREKLVNKPDKGQFDKADLTPKRYLREIKISDMDNYAVGSILKCDVFASGEKVDVSGTSKGHGFTGNIKRWNQAMGPAAHGSGYHRGVGALAANSDPSRVFKGRKLPGHYGCDKVTVQNLEVVKVDVDRNLLLIKGAIPGARGSLVTVKSAVKV